MFCIHTKLQNLCSWPSWGRLIYKNIWKNNMLDILLWFFNVNININFLVKTDVKTDNVTVILIVHAYMYSYWCIIFCYIHSLKALRQLDWAKMLTYICFLVNLEILMKTLLRKLYDISEWCFSIRIDIENLTQTFWRILHTNFIKLLEQFVLSNTFQVLK